MLRALSPDTGAHRDNCVADSSQAHHAKVVEQELVVRVLQREENKKYHVMKFRASINQDFIKWTGSRMVRENNQKIVQSKVSSRCVLHYW